MKYTKFTDYTDDIINDLKEGMISGICGFVIGFIVYNMGVRG